MPRWDALRTTKQGNKVAVFEFRLQNEADHALLEAAIRELGWLGGSGNHDCADHSIDVIWRQVTH